EPLESITGLRTFCRIAGVNSQRSEVELIKIIGRVFLYGGGELFLLPGNISFRPRQPACDDVISRSVPISPRDPFECFPRQIKLPKPQRSGSEIELTVQVFREQSRY